MTIIKYVKPLRWLLIGSLSSVTLSLGFGIAVRYLLPTSELGPQIGLVMLWIACYVLPAWLVYKAIRSSFRRASRTQLLATIVGSYASLLLVFTGLYYNMSDVADNVDAWESYRYYNQQALLKAKNPDRQVRPLVGTNRAFRGIETRLWDGVETTAQSNPIYHTEPTHDEILAKARQPAGLALRDNSKAWVSVLLDCFHFSVMTMTTVGYGDITPATWYSKLAADLQSLTALALFVVALGMLFGNWWGDQTVIPEQKSPNNAAAGTVSP